MTWEEFQKTRQFLEKKSLDLMIHEDKKIATTGFPLENYRRYSFDDRTFYSVKTNVFKLIIDEYHQKAQEKYPEKFGTGNALDVIEAIYKINPIFKIEAFIEFLRNEQFAYIIESQDGEIMDKILRVDLFRKLNINETGQKEFTGGIFHAFKHFSINNLNLSTGKDIQNISYPEVLLHLVTKAFFTAKINTENSFALETRVGINDKYCLKFVFYLEKNTQIYFIKTIHKVRK